MILIWKQVHNMFNNQHLCKHKYFIFFMKKRNPAPSILLHFDVLSVNLASIYFILSENVDHMFTCI